jgi:hypothetical protein
MVATEAFFEGKVLNWGDALLWPIAIGSASGGFTAFVFRIIVGMKDGNHLNQAA